MRNSAFVAAVVVAVFGGVASADPTGFQHTSQQRTVQYSNIYPMHPEWNNSGSATSPDYGPWSASFQQAQQTSTLGAGRITYDGNCWTPGASIPPNQYTSSSNLVVKFTINEPTAYAINGEKLYFASNASVKLTGPGNVVIAQTPLQVGPFSFSGELQPGDYTYQAIVAAAQGSFNAMTADFTLDLPAKACPSDVSPAGGDGFVGIDDLFAVINAWGACPNPGACATDIVPVGGNGAADVDDLFAVINAWGDCPTGK